MSYKVKLHIGCVKHFFTGCMVLTFLMCFTLLLLAPSTYTAAAQPTEHIPTSYMPATTCWGCAPVVGYIGVMVNYGNIHLVHHQYYEAIVCYDIALKNDPNNFMALLGKGYALEKLEKYDEAIIYFDKVLKIYPNNPYAILFKEDSLYEKAVDLGVHGKYKDAVIYYSLVLRMDPKFVLTTTDLEIIHNYTK